MCLSIPSEYLRIICILYISSLIKSIHTTNSHVRLFSRFKNFHVSLLNFSELSWRRPIFQEPRALTPLFRRYHWGCLFRFASLTEQSYVYKTGRDHYRMWGERLICIFADGERCLCKKKFLMKEHRLKLLDLLFKMWFFFLVI